ncbi:MAG TPA: TldD/PmbA family protein [Terriglobia bacterium]|nr:TldD/PmbA family protein [Terriglobia bacterium]
MTDLQQLAQDVIASALKSGATAADCTIREGSEFHATVRCGELEQLKEAGSKAIGLRVFCGQRVASAYSSDFTAAGVAQLVASALAAARVTSEDPMAGLPPPEEAGQITEDLELFHEDVAQRDPAALIAAARRAERAAFEFDPRIRNSEGSTFSASAGRKLLVNSQGFCGEYRRTSCSLSVTPIAVPAEEGNAAGMQQDYWYTASRRLAALEPPEQVGRKAAERAVRRLGARKVPTARVPVVFDQRTAGQVLGSLLEAVSGDAVYRKASFLAGKLGQTIAAPSVTVVDDGTLRGGFGTVPFDDEGVRTRRTVVVENGVLQSYLLNSYTARKLGMKTTGNASRGLAGNPGVGAHNFFLQPGSARPEEIIRSVKNGFYVTDFMGHGVNLVTGDLSYGAAGLWIANGELAYPVEEVTVAGNLLEMFQGIAAIGSDLEFRGWLACPTLLIAEMTVAGT